MATFADKDFGEVSLTRRQNTSRIAARLSPTGQLKISAPKLMPLFLVRGFLNSNRTHLLELQQKQHMLSDFFDGQQIGKSHTLIIRSSESTITRVTNHGTSIVVSLAKDQDIKDSIVAQKIHDAILKALRIEAKNHLPRRLAFHATEMGASYQKVRFSHASSRWGSCSSSGTISLNIALMKLPFELIDYVLVHELAHTFEMNHSDSFWRIVQQFYPNYKKARATLKNEHPGI